MTRENLEKTELVVAGAAILFGIVAILYGAYADKVSMVLAGWAFCWLGERA